MSCYKITDRATGDAYFAVALDGIDTDACDVLTIVDGRPPEGIEDIDDAGNIIVPLAAAQQMKRREVDIHLAGQFGAGFTPASGPLAGHVLQVRDNDDRTNWLTSQAAYSAAVAGGAGAVLDAEFRTAANDTIVCSYADGLQTLLDMADWGKRLMKKSWTLKDAIAALTDATAVLAFDVAAEWAALP